MTAQHIKKLAELRKKRKAIQEEEYKVAQEIANVFFPALIESGALEIDFDVFMGGVLEVIEKANKTPDKMEAWKEAGQKFRKGRRKNQTSKSSSKTKKAA